MKVQKIFIWVLILMILIGTLPGCSKKKTEGKINPDDIKTTLNFAVKNNEKDLTYKNVVLTPKKEKAVKQWVSIGAQLIIAGTVTWISQGTLAPVVGQWLGSTFMGLHGIAATNAGLAFLGGGALGTHALAFGMAGGTMVVATISDVTTGFIAQTSLDLLSDAGGNKFHKQAKKELNNNNTSLVESLYRESITNDLDILKSYYALGTLDIYNKKYGEAINTFQQILKYYPNSSMVLYQLGLAQLMSGYDNNGIESLKKAIQLEPYWEEPYITLYQTYLDKEQDTVAFELLMSGVKINPKSFQLNLQSGISFANKNDLNAAIAYFSSALENNDKSSDAYLLRGLSYLKLNKKKEALNDFLEVNDLLESETPYGVKMTIGEIYLGIGKKDESVKYFQDALSIITAMQKQHNNPQLSLVASQLNKMIISNKPSKKPWWKVWGAS